MPTAPALNAAECPVARRGVDADRWPAIALISSRQNWQEDESAHEELRANHARRLCAEDAGYYGMILFLI